MDPLVLVIVLIPVGWHLGLAAVVAYDSLRVGMDRRKWTAIALLVPVFGFFAYLLERSELSYDPETDPYRRGEYNVHPSRRDDEDE